MDDEATWKTPAGPCSTCPCVKATPPGVWHDEEYDKLPKYDGETWQQLEVAPFLCHYQNGDLCGGWLGMIDLDESLALRVAVSAGHVAPDVFDYATEVPCWESGVAAAAHGKSEPTRETHVVIDRIENRLDKVAQ